MTDLHARVVAAIQQVRDRTPRKCDNWCYPNTRDEYAPMHSQRCDTQWAERVDARLAACVEALLDNVRHKSYRATSGDIAVEQAFAAEQALAAFLAAQKETT